MGRGIRVGFLESCDEFFPFLLSRQGGKTGIVFLPVKFVDGVHNHEQDIVHEVYLHVKNADLMDSGLDFGPHIGMGFLVSGDEVRIILQSEYLTIAFHFNSSLRLMQMPCRYHL